MFERQCRYITYIHHWFTFLQCSRVPERLLPPPLCGVAPRCPAQLLLRVDPHAALPQPPPPWFSLLYCCQFLYVVDKRYDLPCRRVNCWMNWKMLKGANDIVTSSWSRARISLRVHAGSIAV